MVDRDDYPHLSGPDEVAECYDCGGEIEEIPTVVSPGTPAGDTLDLSEDELVEVCDKCMTAVANEVTGDSDQHRRSLSTDLNQERTNG